MEDESDVFKDQYSSVVYEIPGGLLFGSRIDIRAKPSGKFRRFSITLQGDVEGTPDAGIALSFRFDATESQITLISSVQGDEVERSTSVDIDLFADKYFVFGIETLPLQYRIFVDDIVLTELVHRMDVHRVEFIKIYGDLLIFCVEISHNFSQQQLLPVGRDYMFSPKRFRKSYHSKESGLDEQSIRKQTLDILPEEYKDMIDEIDRASVTLDEELERLSRTSDVEVENPDALSLKSSTKSSDGEDETSASATNKKSQRRGLKKFLGKIGKHRKNKKAEQVIGRPQIDYSKQVEMQSTEQNSPRIIEKKLKTISLKSESEDAISDFSTDMESYLQKSDSDLDGYDSPTQFLEELHDYSEKPRDVFRAVDQTDVSMSVPQRVIHLDNQDRDSGVSIELGHNTVCSGNDAITSEEAEARLHSLMSSALSNMHKNRQDCECRCHDSKEGRINFHVVHHHLHHPSDGTTTKQPFIKSSPETDNMLQMWQKPLRQKDANVMTVKQTWFQKCFWCCEFN